MVVPEYFERAGPNELLSRFFVDPRPARAVDIDDVVEDVRRREDMLIAVVI